MERKNEGNARSDENKGENRCEQGQTQTKHEWDGMGDGDKRNRLQMAGYDGNDSHSKVGDVTKYRALCSTHQFLVTRPTRSQVRINAGMLCDSKNHLCVIWNMSRGSEDNSLGSRGQSAGSAGSRVVSWKRVQTPIGEATKPFDDRCQLE